MMTLSKVKFTEINSYISEGLSGEETRKYSIGCPGWATVKAYIIVISVTVNLDKI